MKVAIVDYGAGNLHSAAKAFERAAREAEIPASIVVTADPDLVREAERIVLPGVGAFSDCCAGLRSVAGMWETLEEQVIARAKPFLGICVGMQLMAERGLEHDISQGFGWLRGDVKRIEPADPSLKIPHMGWNTLELAMAHPLLQNLELGAAGLHAYFVHSYHLAAADPSTIVATSHYGMAVTAVAGQANFVGTQFHPEKSQTLGLMLIANFLSWRP